jgi:hypothetical protein
MTLLRFKVMRMRNSLDLFYFLPDEAALHVPEFLAPRARKETTKLKSPPISSHTGPLDTLFLPRQAGLFQGMQTSKSIELIWYLPLHIIVAEQLDDVSKRIIDRQESRADKKGRPRCYAYFDMLSFIYSYSVTRGDSAGPNDPGEGIQVAETHRSSPEEHRSRMDPGGGNQRCSELLEHAKDKNREFRQFTTAGQGSDTATIPIGATEARDLGRRRYGSRWCRRPKTIDL